MMRRGILFLLTIASLTISASNSLSLPTLSGKPQDTLSVFVQLDCADAVTAIEVVLPLSPYIRYVDVSAVLNTARSNGHALYARSANDTLYVQIYSLSLSALQETSGELFSFRLALLNEPQVLTLQPLVKMVDAQGQSLSATVAAGQITTLAPKIAILTPTIDYGHHPIRQTYTQYLSLQNIGTSPLTIDSLSLPATLFAYDGKTHTIAAGATEDIPIRYAPVQRGAYSGKLHIYSDGTNAALRVNSEVTIVADPFSVNELHVGSASGIADSLVTIPLTMNNMEPIVAMQCAFRLPKELVFDTGSLCVSTARTNGHAVFSSVQGDTLSLYIYSPTNQPLLLEDGEVASFRLRLNGNSGTYYLTPIDVILSNVTSENMVSATSGGSVYIRSPRLYCDDNIIFSDSPVTEETNSTLTVRNTGDAPLVLERATFLAEGYHVAETLPISIDSWSETTLTVVYQPSVEGDVSTIMNLYTNDPTARMKAIPLSGHIYEPNSLSVAGTNDPKSGAYTLSVSLSNYSDIVAVQFDVHWISAMTTSKTQCTPSLRMQQHSYAVSQIGDADYRILVYSLENTSISGHDGELLQLLFSPPEDSTVNYNGTTITVDNIVLSNIRGEHKQSQSAVTHFVDQSPSPTDITTPATCSYLVYPNPATDIVHLHGDDIARVQVFSSAGTLVYATHPSGASPDLVLDVHAWAAGVYTVVLYDSTHAPHTLRLIKGLHM